MKKIFHATEQSRAGKSSENDYTTKHKFLVFSLRLFVLARECLLLLYSFILYERITFRSTKAKEKGIFILDVLPKCNYNANMNFEWDDTKRKSNIQKHGIDFIDTPEIFAGYTLTIEDDRSGYDEKRFVTFGILDGRVVAVVHTEAENLIRIISIRKATKNEEKEYFSQISD